MLIRSLFDATSRFSSIMRSTFLVWAFRMIDHIMLMSERNLIFDIEVRAKSFGSINRLHRYLLPSLVHRL